jgi:hypothetical protein
MRVKKSLTDDTLELEEIIIQYILKQSYSFYAF